MNWYNDDHSSCKYSVFWMHECYSEYQLCEPQFACTVNRERTTHTHTYRNLCARHFKWAEKKKTTPNTNPICQLSRRSIVAVRRRWIVLAFAAQLNVARNEFHTLRVSVLSWLPTRAVSVALPKEGTGLFSHSLWEFQALFGQHTDFHIGTAILFYIFCYTSVGWVDFIQFTLP